MVCEHALPGYEHAVIPPEKLRDYALNPGHRAGKDKARKFAGALAIERQHWMYLQDQILEALPESEAVLHNETVRWQNWTVPILVSGRNSRRAFITTGWTIETGTLEPRLSTAYVEKSARNRELLAP